MRTALPIAFHEVFLMIIGPPVPQPKAYLLAGVEWTMIKDPALGGRPLDRLVFCSTRHRGVHEVRGRLCQRADEPGHCLIERRRPWLAERVRALVPVGLREWQTVGRRLYPDLLPVEPGNDDELRAALFARIVPVWWQKQHERRPRA